MDQPPRTTPLVSIIIPVRNGGRTLEACLRAIMRSSYPMREIIVVDDHSSDDTLAVAQRCRARIVSMNEQRGANNARNLGASVATGDILVFVDADIMVRRDTVLELVEALDDGMADAVVGIYTAKHRHESFVSQYKNLWVRYSYLKSPPVIDWLFGSISGITRRAFELIGGFDTRLLARHGNDDIELGKRFVQAQLKILLDLDVEVEHLKEYTAASFVRNEFDRSAGFARLASELGEIGASVSRGFANVSRGFIVSTILAVLLGLFGAGSLARWCSPWWPGVTAALYFIVNIRFLNYLEQVRGLFAMLAMIPILYCDHLICFAGSVRGIFGGEREKSRG